MPRPISRIALKILDFQDNRPFDLLSITLVGQDPAQSLRFCNEGEAITWRGDVYQPISMQVSQIEERLASAPGEVPSTQVTISNVDAQIASLLSAIELDGSTASIWRSRRGGGQVPVPQNNGPVPITVGEIREVSLTNSAINFKILSVLGQLERITVPRRCWQSHCNYTFGEPACTVNIKTGTDSNGIPITFNTTAQAGSTRQYLVLPSSVFTAAGSPSDATFFSDATLWIADGVAGLQQRPFQRFDSATNRYWVRSPFIKVPAPGDPVVLRRACKKTIEDCTIYLGSADQFGGFKDVPPVRFKPQEVRM